MLKYIMACQSCAGFEHFTQQRVAQENTMQEGCFGKSTVNKCLYTAQGVYMCMRDDKPDIKNNGVVDNESMMLEAFRDGKKFNNAAPW